MTKNYDRLFQSPFLPLLNKASMLIDADVNAVIKLPLCFRTASTTFLMSSRVCKLYFARKYVFASIASLNVPCKKSHAMSHVFVSSMVTIKSCTFFSGSPLANPTVIVPFLYSPQIKSFNLLYNERHRCNGSVHILFPYKMIRFE